MRKAHARHQAAERRTFLDVEIDVDLVVEPGHGRRFHIHLVEITEALQAHARAVDLLGGNPAAFHLADFAAHHVVAGAGIAGAVAAAHIHTLVGIDEEGELDRALVAVEVGGRIDVGEGIAFLAEAFVDARRALGDFAPRKNIAGLDADQRRELGLGHYEDTRELDLAHGELLALDHVDADVDVLLVGTNSQLGGLDVEVDVAAIEIIGPQRLEVGCEFLLGVLIVLADHRHQGRRPELKHLEQFCGTEVAIANQIDLADFGDFALVDLETDVDAVAFQRFGLAGDLDAVFAAREILAFEFTLHLFEGRTIEDATHNKTKTQQRVSELFGANIFIAGEFDLVDGRPLLDRHHQDITDALQAHIRKNSCLVF